MRLILLSIFAGLFLTQCNTTKITTYEVQLEPVVIPDLGGIHSYVYGQLDNEYLIIGGRLDGLHRRKPFAAFDISGNHKELLVLNPKTKQHWRASLDLLPNSIKEQLSSTNMQFCQDENELILIGGYGYSPSLQKHLTFPYSIKLNVEKVIEAVKSNSVQDGLFEQNKSEEFAVTGGGLEKINDMFYLVAGHRFDGQYNPTGPEIGPSFMQKYTNEIQLFSLMYHDDKLMSVFHQSNFKDKDNLHRRDFNMLPVTLSESKSLMLFSGVFQEDADVPYLSPVHITPRSQTVDSSFIQYFNHYLCPTIAIHNKKRDEMDYIFFGGIAQFYMDHDTLVQDNDIPFVQNITHVNRNSTGQWQEQLLEQKMPAYFGTGAEFLPIPDASLKDGIIDDKVLSKDFIALGYLYGGIKSREQHVFYQDDESLSEATANIYRVLVKKSKTKKVPKKINEEQVFLYPDPVDSTIVLYIDLEIVDDLEFAAYHPNGKLITKKTIDKSRLVIGTNKLLLRDVKVPYGKITYTIKNEQVDVIRKVSWLE